MLFLTDMWKGAWWRQTIQTRSHCVASQRQRGITEWTKQQQTNCFTMMFAEHTNKQVLKFKWSFKLEKLCTPQWVLWRQTYWLPFTTIGTLFTLYWTIITQSKPILNVHSVLWCSAKEWSQHFKKNLLFSGRLHKALRNDQNGIMSNKLTNNYSDSTLTKGLTNWST